MGKSKRAFFMGARHVSGKTWSICNILVGKMEHLTHVSRENGAFYCVKKVVGSDKYNIGPGEVCGTSTTSN